MTLDEALKRIKELSQELAGAKAELKNWKESRTQAQAGSSPDKKPDPLSEEQENLQLILDNIPVMITVYDLQTLKFQVNKEFEKVLGWTQQDIASRNLVEVLLPDPGDQQAALEYISHPRPGFRDFKTRARDGSLVDTSWANIELPDGRQLGVGIDIRERKQTEAEMLRIQAALNQAEQMAHLGAWWSDVHDYTRPDAGSLNWSAEVYRIFGYEPGSVTVTNKLFLSHVHPDDVQKVREAVSRAFSEQRAYSVEHRIIRTDGSERVVLAHGNIDYDTQGRPMRIIGAIQDVTAQKQTEEKLRTINRELEQFAYVASHDLQEPLRMVASFSELLERRYADLFDERGQRYLLRIKEGANRMQQLIEDLLTFSRVGRLDTDRSLIDCNQLVDTVIAGFAKTIRETGAIIRREELPLIRANETSMIQVFQNLLSNALKFRKPDEPPQITVSARKKGQEWIFMVKDNGIGIEPRFFDKIFVIFQRLHSREEYPGTGMGLAICKKIIDTYGGKIWVESAAGRGAAFYFSIPA